MKIIQSNGAAIPAIGLGTWELREAQCAQIVEAAIGCGYTHIDTAQMYQNEREVSQGIRASGVPREQIFVTTKVWPDCFKADDFARAVDERLELLDTGPVDLLLLHWPSRVVPLAETMKALNKAKQAGLTRHIGISNFNVAQIDEAMALTDEPLVANQVEFHPLINQDKVRAACARHGLALTAYCPIARNKVADETVIREIAQRHGASSAQIALAWLLQHDGIIAVPRSSRPDRLADNLAAMDISLSDDEMAAIDGLNKQSHLRLVDPVDMRPVWDVA